MRYLSVLFMQIILLTAFYAEARADEEQTPPANTIQVSSSTDSKVVKSNGDPAADAYADPEGMAMAIGQNFSAADFFQAGGY